MEIKGQVKWVWNNPNEAKLINRGGTGFLEVHLFHFLLSRVVPYWYYFDQVICDII